MPTASIIIPVYNAEKHIGRCLNSILAQTYKDIEIICIDDGSRDNSYQLLQEYKAKYPDKFNIYTQENMGTGKTRNNGIRYAAGKYIFFIDNDDYIDNNYIKEYVQAAEKTDADMVIGGYKRVDENGKCIYWDKVKSNPDWEPFKRLAPWGRIYKKDFIVENKLEFLDNIIGEDDYFNAIAATISKKIEVIDYVGYYWVFNTKSISNTQHVDPNLPNAAVYLLNCIYDKVNVSELTRGKYECIEYMFVKFVVWFLLFYGNKFSSEMLISSYNSLFEALEQFFPNYKKNRLIGFFTPQGEHPKTKLSVAIFVLLIRTGLAVPFLKLYCAKH